MSALTPRAHLGVCPNVLINKDLIEHQIRKKDMHLDHLKKKNAIRNNPYAWHR